MARARVASTALHRARWSKGPRAECRPPRVAARDSGGSRREEDATRRRLSSRKHGTSRRAGVAATMMRASRS